MQSLSLWLFSLPHPCKLATVVLVDENAALRYRVPADGSEDGVWTNQAVVDTAWNASTFAVGHGFFGLTATDAGRAGSLYMRIPLTVPVEPIVSLTLRMRYDDGFVAYLNGTEVASANAPPTTTFSSLATTSHPDAQAIQFVDFNVNAGALDAGGRDVLAIHGMNVHPGNPDLLFDARLEEVTIPEPGTTVFCTLGLLAVVFARHRSRRHTSPL